MGKVLCYPCVIVKVSKGLIFLVPLLRISFNLNKDTVKGPLVNSAQPWKNYGIRVGQGMLAFSRIIRVLSCTADDRCWQGLLLRR